MLEPGFESRQLTQPPSPTSLPHTPHTQGIRVGFLTTERQDLFRLGLSFLNYCKEDRLDALRSALWVL